MKYALFLLLISCSAPKPKELTPAEDYFQVWSQDYYAEEKEFQEAYKAYLLSVEELFKVNKISDKFDGYLQSVNNFHQLMAHAEFNLPFTYKRLNGPKADIRLKAYEDFKNRNLGLQYDKLAKEHETKLKEDLGDDFFSKLVENFQKKVPATFASHKFPL